MIWWMVRDSKEHNGKLVTRKLKKTYMVRDFLTFDSNSLYINILGNHNCLKKLRKENF
jgi:hypothetical protein